MLYMVIEHFKDRNAAAIYKRFQVKGRMMPDGLNYIDSWVEPDQGRCFQLMETDDPALFDHCFGLRHCECAFGEMRMFRRSSSKTPSISIFGRRNSIVSGGLMVNSATSRYALMIFAPRFP